MWSRSSRLLFPQTPENIITVRNVVEATRLCFHRLLSFCSGGGACIPACTGQTPPSLDRHTPPPVKQPPYSDTPPCPVHAGIQIPPHPPLRPLQRTVRILLECILVMVNHTTAVVLYNTVVCSDNSAKKPEQFTLKNLKPLLRWIYHYM